ncbi:hypothetical protein L7F22_055867 [Adiantum nelumboides]|nr:hypothetical protein [Adiantum nelumboides]
MMAMISMPCRYPSSSSSSSSSSVDITAGFALPKNAGALSSSSASEDHLLYRRLQLQHQLHSGSPLVLPLPGRRSMISHSGVVCSAVGNEVFQSFKRGKEFICFEGQTSQAVTGMHNLYRAAQVKLPGETILEEIKGFTEVFLKNRQLNDTLQDKWVISNGLKDEVSYTLSFPWKQSLQQLEARNFIGHYGVDDAWIAKSLYKMPYVNNEIFLKLAKENFNLCQSFHKKELAQVLRWNKECKFHKLGFARQKSVECFFSVAATLFEPEYSFARIVWATSGVLTTIIDDFFDTQGSLQQLTDFLNAVKTYLCLSVPAFKFRLKKYHLPLTSNMLAKIHSAKERKKKVKETKAHAQEEAKIRILKCKQKFQQQSRPPPEETTPISLAAIRSDEQWQIGIDVRINVRLPNGRYQRALVNT